MWLCNDYRFCFLFCGGSLTCYEETTALGALQYVSTNSVPRHLLPLSNLLTRELHRIVASYGPVLLLLLLLLLLPPIVFHAAQRDHGYREDVLGERLLSLDVALVPPPHHLKTRQGCERDQVPVSYTHLTLPTKA